MHNQLDRIINLVRKTGDRLVVLDRDNLRKSYVVMDIKEYERLVNCCGLGDWKEDESEAGEDEEDYEGYGDKLWREDEDGEDEDWDFKAEDIFKDQDDEFDNLPDSGEFDFGEPPLVKADDERQPEAKDDFVPIGDIFNEVDNNWEYGTIKQNLKESKKNGGQRRGKWEIAPEIKKTAPADAAAEEDDRYYLETI